MFSAEIRDVIWRDIHSGLWESVRDCTYYTPYQILRDQILFPIDSSTPGDTPGEINRRMLAVRKGLG